MTVSFLQYFIVVFTKRPSAVRKYLQIWFKDFKHFLCTQMEPEKCEKIAVEIDYKKIIIRFVVFFLKKKHKLVGSVRRRLFLQLSEAQSTGVRWRQPPLETAARWRYEPIIKNLTAPYNSQFFVSWEAIRRF